MIFAIASVSEVIHWAAWKTRIALSLMLLAMTVGSALALLRCNVSNPRRVRRNIVETVFEVNALRRSRVLCERHPWPPFPCWPDRPRDKSAAAVRAHIAELVLDAVRTERAFIATDARLRRIGRKVLVAIFAVGPELQRHCSRPVEFSSEVGISSRVQARQNKGQTGRIIANRARHSNGEYPSISDRQRRMSGPIFWSATHGRGS